MQAHSMAQGRFKLKHVSMLVALALPALVYAQDEKTADATLPEVVVQTQTLGATTEGTGSYTTGKTGTALPLSTSPRDTPQSVSVITQQVIQDQALHDVKDVVNNAVGVSSHTYETNRATFTSRGFDIDNLQIDGVPTTWDQSWSSGEIFSSLAIYDRVEIVRGATGLMTGAGNPSAAINLIRKRATSNDLTGTAEIGIGSWNQRRAMADLSTAVNAAGTLRMRVVGEQSDGDSWVQNLSNKKQTLYATLEADLAPSTQLDIGISDQNNKSKGPMWGGLPVWYSDGSRTNWDISKTSAASWTRWNTDYENVFANLEHRFDNGWKAKISFSQGNRTADSYLLYLYGSPDRLTGLGLSSWPGSYYVTTRQDDYGAHFSGPVQLGGRTHELAFGYTYSEQKFNAQSRTASTFPSVGNFNTWDGSFPEPSWGPLSFYETATTKQEALYAAARFNLADPLKVILGSRLTNYTKTDQNTSTTSNIDKNNILTPYVGVVFDLNQTYSLYGSYTDIFQPQNLMDTSGKMLAPITGKSSEVGIKGEYFGGRLNSALSFFDILQKNKGVSLGTFDPDGAGPLPVATYYAAADGITSKGFEFELSGELSPGWNLTGGYTQFRATNADGTAASTIYPNKEFRLFTTYRLPGAWNALTLGGGVNWQAATYTYATNPATGANEKIEQSAYSLFNLTARYDFSKQLSAQLNINNVFNKKYFALFDAYDQLTYGEPRNAMLNLRYKF